LVYNRFIGPTLIFNRLELFFKFLLFTVVLTGIISLFLSLFSLHLWILWWFANLDGILIVGIGLLTWDAYFPEIHKLFSMKKFHMLMLYFLLLVTWTILFFNTKPIFILILSSISFFLLFWISISYGWCGTLGGLFLSAMTSCIFSSIKTPFFYISFSYNYIAFLLFSQLFLGLFIATNS
jgi:hypothetical protein